MRFNSLKSFKSFKIGKSKEKLDEDATKTGDTLTTQIADLGKQVNDRTKDLVETEQQLKELASTAKSPAKDEEAPPQPHGPLSELSVEPEDKLKDEETDTSPLAGQPEGGVKLVEAKPQAAPPAEAATKAEVKVVEAVAGADATAAKKEPTKGEENDSLNNLFNQEDEEENPLANLINSLPDVTVQELLDDLHEIKEIMRETQQN